LALLYGKAVAFYIVTLLQALSQYVETPKPTSVRPAIDEPRSCLIALDRVEIERRTRFWRRSVPLRKDVALDPLANRPTVEAGLPHNCGNRFAFTPQRMNSVKDSLP
jgi:hypothetical protein